MSCSSAARPSNVSGQVLLGEPLRSNWPVYSALHVTVWGVVVLGWGCEVARGAGDAGGGALGQSVGVCTTSFACRQSSRPDQAASL